MYDAKSFKDIFNSSLGQEIWHYLKSEEVIGKMILTTQLGHPAAEGIGDILLDKFGIQIKEDRIKRAIGHMIKHIMDENGYKHAQRSVRCRKKTELFTFASRYEKK
jgi:hypothetical protein